MLTSNLTAEHHTLGKLNDMHQEMRKIKETQGSMDKNMDRTNKILILLLVLSLVSILVCFIR